MQVSLTLTRPGCDLLKADEIFLFPTNSGSHLPLHQEKIQKNMPNNFFTQDNVVRFLNQFDIFSPKDDESLGEWITKNREKLAKLANKNVFRIYKDENGVQRIKILGYIYCSDNTSQHQAKNWVRVQFMWFEMPLAVYKRTDPVDRAEWEYEIKQLYSDHTEKDALELLVREYAPIFIAEDELNDDTPEGVYVLEPYVAEEALFFNEDVFGDEKEHAYDVVCYDGYAIATAKGEGVPVKLEVTYPLLEDVLSNEEQSEYVLNYRGLFDLKPRDIHYGDIMFALGKIIRYTAIN